MMCMILPGRKREVLAFGCTFCFPVTRSVVGSGAVASSCGGQSEMCSPGKDGGIIVTNHLHLSLGGSYNSY